MGGNGNGGKPMTAEGDCAQSLAENAENDEGLGGNRQRNDAKQRRRGRREPCRKTNGNENSNGFLPQSPSAVECRLHVGRYLGT